MPASTSTPTSSKEATTSANAAATWGAEARWLRAATILWAVVGLLVLFSASMPLAEANLGDGLFFVKRQLVWLAVGFGIFTLLVRLPLSFLFRVGGLVYIIALCLVGATLITSLGVNRLDATRWLNLGVIIIQPSEFLKPALLLQASWVFGRWFHRSWLYRLFWLVLFTLGLVGILLQPNLGTTAVCGLTLWFMAGVAGVSGIAMLSSAGVGVAAAVFSVTIKSYQFRRLSAFLDPWASPRGDGYQLVQSLMAIGSGGPWGKGFGLSQQKLFYLPIQYTDFIFSVFAEELGLVGTLSFLGLLAIYTLLGLRVAYLSQSMPKRLIAFGAIWLLVGQSLLNIGVVSGLLPTTGVPLPLFSYGGSSALASLMIAGLLVRAAREASWGEVIPLPTATRRNPANSISPKPELRVVD